MSPEPAGVVPEVPPPQRDLTAHRRVAAVLQTLALHHVHPELRQLPGAVRTAQAAAEALGVTPAEIANSLVFAARTAEGATEPLLVLASGGHRVDTTKVAGLLELADLAQATPEFVRRYTGMAIGGVAPVGHPERIRTVVDVTLGRYDRVWAAAGHSHAVFATTYDELIRITGGTPMDVA
ncbi:YbaK/EbsC family protein [Phycicoccus endophyticus]|uniref:YbaK/EbsC family protein n=1 Tax=Phycicoccus endophyticus TaxID=1690220 RepID=A0A7G9R4X1_9MICO|nr:YbaK/EbsC family protein [Phycicoccus endophyticus]NHI18578.1 YbaK/EbsC family protein [Phycicoccus endophyticus]QNN50646.1 YbaK/EbsC family protein [Phycicoccus endophyticus]GGL22702.1 aminoacyl-tRNA deacylase [Phycicoccus endophyticus]